MTNVVVTMPYEKQSDPQSSRMCGAACLSMVYRSFGVEVPQEQIWPKIAKENPFGSLACATHLMTGHALRRGFSALAIQSRNPLQTLRRCKEENIRAILNLRLQWDTAMGHYVVLVDIDDKLAVLHDPFFGPSRRVSHAELLALWQPSLANSEIVGNTLIAISSPTDEVFGCQVCSAPLPRSVACPRCAKQVSLLPGTLLGCVHDSCEARNWNHVCCPACDYTWSFELQRQKTESAVPKQDDDPWNLTKLSGELEKFCSQILSLAPVANHAELKRQIAEIQGKQDELQRAQADHIIHLKTHAEQLAAMTKAADQRQKAHTQRATQLNPQVPTLDGNALGRDLLRNLGFSK
jgi:hypothetical protein